MFHRLSSWLWMLAVAMVVLLAVYVSVGKLLSANLSTWQDQVLAELNRHLPFHVDAANLEGSWHSFTPEIALHDLEITLPEGGRSPLNLIGGRVGVDVLESLSSRSLQFTSLQLEALELQAQLTPEGKLVVPGFTSATGEVGGWLREFLLNLESLELRNNTVDLQFPGGARRQLTFDISLSRAGSERQISAYLVSSSGTRVRFSGSGLGDPFLPDSFVGNAYATFDIDDLTTSRPLFDNPPAAWPEGRLQGQAWLQWDSGNPTLDLDLKASALQFVSDDGAWVLPLEALALVARIEGEMGDWRLFLDQGRIEGGGTAADLPHLQSTLRDGQLHVRIGETALGPLNDVMQRMSMPEQWQEVASSLAPRGCLSATDIHALLEDDSAKQWLVEGEFSELKVGSWRGAPGVVNAAGVFRLDAQGASVALDSQDFSIAFPTVYAQPLAYQTARGRIDIGWDENSVNLHSGLISVNGEEGNVQALFGLAIPLQQTDAGVEMELLTGLRDSHPRYRSKYIPEVLNEGLRNWLTGAVGEGRIAEAGFIWRGSLNADAAPLRTVQVMVDFADMEVAYQPDWPPLQEVSGSLLVDDVRVSVWADKARVYESQVSHLSAETWPDAANDDLELTVDLSLAGRAGDGLAVVQNSPLNDLTEGAFEQWQAAGELAAELKLVLNLARPDAAPLVDLDAALDKTSLTIQPGDLQLEDIAGHLLYQSDTGFNSQQLGATLWGHPVAIDVSPQSSDPKGQQNIAFSGKVSAQAVQAWSGLAVLKLADGVADVRGKVAVVPGAPPVLTLSSSLEGVALNLPEPWSKPPEAIRDFSLSMPLSGAQRKLALALGENVALELGMSQGRVDAAALGVNRAVPELEPGVVLLAGSADFVDVGQWQSFADQYLLVANTQESPLGGAPDPNTASAPDPQPALALKIDGMQVGHLRLWGNGLDNVDFSFSSGEGDVTARFATDWIAGRYQSRAGHLAQLTLDRIDFGTLQLQKPEAIAQAVDPNSPDAKPQANVSQLPDMALTNVVVEELLWKDRSLGSMQFRLEGDAGVFQASRISGEVAGLVLSDDRAATFEFTEGEGTRLSALLEFDDFGESLAALGYTQSLETSSGTLDLALQWAGTPQDFSLANLNGSLAIHGEDGRFLQTPEGAGGALKVVEIFNLAGVVQRLSLSHVFESGLAFDRMDGQVHFYPGTIELNDFTVQSSASTLSMRGVSDVASRNLRGELVATLPVANNLPWVAALAGGLPVAAGVFVVSKVFEKQVNRLSSGVYRIGGSWNDPEFTFDRIFDDELRADAVDQAGGVTADPNQPTSQPGDQAPASSSSRR